MATNVTERDAREVAEAARESDWTLPSFGKELFLGNFRLDLIHPQSELDPAAVEKGEAFLDRLRAFLTQRVDLLGEEGAQTLEEALALLGGGGVDARLRVDQVEPEVPEEQLLAEARKGPFGLTRRFGDFSRIALADVARHVLLLEVSVGRSRNV